MSLNNSIINLLNLKDKNIKFHKNFYSEKIVKGSKYMFFHGTLTYKPDACYHCGHIFDRKIIKLSFKLSTIKIHSISGFFSCLKLRKQRYFCKHCQSTFSLRTPIINRNCYISNNTKLSIALNTKEKVSGKDIEKNHNVSNLKVNRIIDSFYVHYKPRYNYLPKHMCFDEFKSVKSAAGAIFFIFCYSDTGNIMYILEDRRLHVLKNYFLRFSKAARRAVQTIVIDMYSPYISLIKSIDKPF